MRNLDGHQLIYVEGDSAVAMYEVGYGDGGSSSTWAATRFKVLDGQIAELETVCNSGEFCGYSS